MGHPSPPVSAGLAHLVVVEHSVSVLAGVPILAKGHLRNLEVCRGIQHR